MISPDRNPTLQVLGSKGHAKVDADGRLLVAKLHAADVPNRDGAVPLLKAASRRGFPLICRSIPFGRAASPLEAPSSAMAPTAGRAGNRRRLRLAMACSTLGECSIRVMLTAALIVHPLAARIRTLRRQDQRSGRGVPLPCRFTGGK